MPPVKVIRIIARLNIGGPAIHAILLTARLDKTKFDSMLVCGPVGKDEGDMGYLAKEYGVEPVVIPQLGRELDLLSDLKSFFKILSLIKRERPDIVHTHTAKAGGLGRLAAKAAGVPVIVHTYHGHVFHSYFSRLKTGFFVLVERLLSVMTDRIITVSRTQQQEIIKYLGSGVSHKTSVVPLGFALKDFLDEPETGDVRRQLGISPDAFVVGIVGRLTAVKNHRMFIDVAENISRQQEGRKTMFLVVGDGELKAELAGLCQRSGIRDKVIFAGWRKDMPSVYKAMDVVTLTSLNEGTPVTVIEGLASARPVVATDVGGVRDVLEDGRDGFIVPRGDIQAFSSAVMRLTDRGMRAAFGHHGRERGRKIYSAENLLKNIEELYESELKRKGRSL